jgi:hypothetical protein
MAIEPVDGWRKHLSTASCGEFNKKPAAIETKPDIIDTKLSIRYRFTGITGEVPASQALSCSRRRD